MNSGILATRQPFHPQFDGRRYPGRRLWGGSNLSERESLNPYGQSATGSNPRWRVSCLAEGTYLKLEPLEVSLHHSSTADASDFNAIHERRAGLANRHPTEGRESAVPFRGVDGFKNLRFWIPPDGEF